MRRGDWRPWMSLWLGGLLCGFFWEMWNLWSFPKWIYHVPGMPYYDATRAEEVFCTEAEARALLAPDPWCSDGRDIQGIGRVRPWTIFLETLIHDFDTLNFLNPAARAASNPPHASQSEANTTAVGRRPASPRSGPSARAAPRALISSAASESRHSAGDSSANSAAASAKPSWNPRW